MSLYEYRVGQLYHPSRTHWPERVIYQCRAGAHELLLFWFQPTPREVGEVRQGVSEFALCVAPPVLVLCCRFGASTWSDSPYSWHLVPEPERLPPPELLTESSRSLLSIILVDAATGIVAALRAQSLAPEFSRVLKEAIEQQARQPWCGSADYDRAIDLMYRQYPTSEAFVAAAVVRCQGGE